MSKYNDGPRTAEELFRDARNYADGIGPQLPEHLRSELEKWDGNGGTAFAKLPFVAEILWAARDNLGDKGRSLLRDIAQWGAFHQQQSLRGDRGEAIAVAIIGDLRAGEVVAQDSDPGIDMRLVKPVPVELPDLPEASDVG